MSCDEVGHTVTCKAAYHNNNLSMLLLAKVAYPKVRSISRRPPEIAPYKVIRKPPIFLYGEIFYLV